MGSWHWEEKNLLPFCKQRLPEVLVDIAAEMSPMEGNGKITGVKTVTGEVGLPYMFCRLFGYFQHFPSLY